MSPQGGRSVAALAAKAAARRSRPSLRQSGEGKRVGIATIGLGGQGNSDTKAMLKVPGVELVAVADLYDGRLKRAREVYCDKLVTTRDYKEILARPDVDAVIIGTPDHWHSRIAIDARNAVQDLYLGSRWCTTFRMARRRGRAAQTKRILHVGIRGPATSSITRPGAAGGAMPRNMVRRGEPQLSPRRLEYRFLRRLAADRDWDAPRAAPAAPFDPSASSGGATTTTTHGGRRPFVHLSRSPLHQ